MSLGSQALKGVSAPIEVFAPPKPQIKAAFMSDALEQSVTAHYQRSGLTGDILAGLEQQGIDLDAIKPQDLAAVDEFHIGGREATLIALELFEADKDQPRPLISDAASAGRHVAWPRNANAG